MKVTDLLWEASLTELRNGFIEGEEYYTCLLCGQKIEKGIVYPAQGILYESERFIRVHIERAHGSVFDYLINLDKRYTGLTDHQNSLLRLFYQGKSDEEIKKEMDIGSNSTIRNHRFGLKEKERQAKVFLTMMDLLKTKAKRFPGLIPPHDTAKMVDDRYNITEEEDERIIKKFFPQGPDGPIRTFDIKAKHRLAVLRQIVKRFDAGRVYSEKEVDAILKTAYVDYATLRRQLIEYGFLDRKPDGSEYWLK